MAMTPTPYDVAFDPGTARTITNADVRCVVKARSNRHSWGIVADKNNTGTVTFSMGGDPTIAVGSVDAGTTKGQATATSFKLAPGQSFSDPVGGNVVYSGSVTATASAVGQVIYTWEY